MTNRGNMRGGDKASRGHPRFASIDIFTQGAHDVVTTTLDRDCEDFSHLVGHVVLIDDVEFVCEGVQCPAAGPPFRKGDHVSLSLKPHTGRAAQGHSASGDDEPDDTVGAD